MFTLVFFLMLLQFRLLVHSLTQPRCFWTMRQNECSKEDLSKKVVFVLFLAQNPMEKEDVTDHLDRLAQTSITAQHKSEERAQAWRLPSQYYQFMLSLVFAMEEINRNPNLLPNVSLNFDFTFVTHQAIQEFNMASSLAKEYVVLPNYLCNIVQKCEMWIIESTLTLSVIFGALLQLIHCPLVTYGPFRPSLNDHDQFPDLYQMAQKDTSLALAMVSLMSHFGWIWVGLAISDDDQGIQFLSDLRGEMERSSVCLAFVNIVPVNMQLYMRRAEILYDQIMTSSAKVVIIYGDTDSVLAVSFKTWKSVGIQRMWVTTSQWDIITSRGDFSLDSLHGVLTFAHHHAEISGFKNFVQTLNHSEYRGDLPARLGWMYFNCENSASQCKTLKNCSANDTLDWLMLQRFDMAMSEGIYDIYNAVYGLAHALHKMFLPQMHNKAIENWNKKGNQCFELNSFLKKTHFTNPLGDMVDMNQKEKTQAEYDIFYIIKSRHSLRFKVKIGKFNPYIPQDQQLYLSEDMVEWVTGSRQMPSSVCSADCHPGFRKFHQEGRVACCFECIPCPDNEISNASDADQCVKCPMDQYANEEQNHCLQKDVVFLAYEDPLGMALASITLGLSAFTALVLGVFVKHHDTPIVKANNRTLSYILLISLIFCFLCTLLFIGQPNSAFCVLQQTVFGVSFTVAVSTVLAKTITVVLAFNVTAPGKRIRWLLVSGSPNYIIPFFTVIQVIFCAMWLGVSPPFIDIDAHSEHGHIIIVCNKGSITAFYCVLGYLGSLALGSFSLAFLARNLPDTFNEAKFLTFSMLVFCSVWVTFLPVYHSTKGKVMMAVEVFSILASSASLLGCIFFPKCYIILFRPDRNSLQKFRGKASSWIHIS